MKRLLVSTTVLLVCMGMAHAQDGSPKLVDGFWVAKTPDGYARITKEDDITVGRWEVECAVDKMVDKRKCLIFGEAGAPVIIYEFEQKPKLVCINGHNYPDRNAMIRVDKNPPITTEPNGCVPAESIMAQISNGRVFLARWAKFPFDRDVDTETSLIGLSVAMQTVADFQNGKMD